jgi:mRNA interferase MazF
VTRAEIYRTRERVAERGAKPGFYVVVSRAFVAENDDISTVICAPVYSQILGLTTEVVLGPDDGLPRASAVRCDFLTLMFKSRLTHFIATLSAAKAKELDRALAVALALPAETSLRRS